MINKKMKLILLGPPGCGKGTISFEMINLFDIVHISTGNLFRACLDEEDMLSKKIQNSMVKGELISDEITNELAKKEIIKNINNDKGFILDGYPRTIGQADFLNSVCKIDKVIYFNIDDEILIKRITGRRTCKNCSKVYNIYTNPSKKENNCDECDFPLFQRKDDDEEIFIQRVSEYREKTMPLVEYYKERNILIEINANQSTIKILKEIQDYLNVD